MAGTASPITGFGSPIDSDVSNAILTINSLFSSAPPDFFSMDAKSISQIKVAVAAIEKSMVFSKDDPEKMKHLMKALDNLKLPRDDVYGKLVFLEDRLKGYKVNLAASGLAESFILGQVNKASEGAQKAKVRQV